MVCFTFSPKFTNVSEVSEGAGLLSSANNGGDSVWTVVFFPRGCQESNKVSVRLNHEGCSVRARVRISINNDAHVSGDFIFANNSYLCFFSQPVEFYMSWNTVTVDCTIDIDDSATFDLSLSERIRARYLAGNLTDFSVVVGQTKIPVHKLILSSQSDVFDTMIRAEMEETRTNEMIITDFSATAVKCFIDLIYGVSTSIKIATYDEKLEVLQIADKYKAKIVVMALVEELYNAMSVEGCLAALVLADALPCPPLRDRTLWFIKSNIQQVIAHHADIAEKLGPLVGVLLSYVCCN